MIRMYHESTMHKQNSFLTLTYDDNNCPQNINKRDLQLFFKRLRKSEGKLRYFACGEYGERTRRPHYHAVIFGHDFKGGAYAINEKLYGNPKLTQIWGLGQVSIGDVTPESCAYVAGYSVKKITDPETFNLMSRRPGIGAGWINRYWDDIARTGKCIIQGREYVIPKKYLETYDAEFAQIKEKRKAFMKNQNPEFVCRRREQHAVRETNLKSRQSLKHSQEKI